MALRTVQIAGAVATAAVMSAALAACNHSQTSAELTQPAGFGLYYNDQGEHASLAYGQANSDNVALMLQCKKGAGRVQVSDMVRAEPAPSLVLTSGRDRSELLTRLDNGMSGAPKMVLADTTTDAQALKNFRRTGRIAVKYGAVDYQVAATREELTRVELFFSVCGKTNEV